MKIAEEPIEDSPSSSLEPISYPLWVLRKAQENAWSQGYARLTARQLAQIRHLQQNGRVRTYQRGFFGQLPGHPGATAPLPKTVVKQINADYEEHTSGSTGTGQEYSENLSTDQLDSGAKSRLSPDTGQQKMETDGLKEFLDPTRPLDGYAKNNLTDLNLLQPSPGLAGGGRGSRKTRRDPLAAGNLLGRLFKQQGLESFLDEGRLRVKWPELVGEAVAKHAKIERIQGNKVTIRCDSTRWANELQLLIPQLMALLEQESGSLTIDSLIIKGPAAPSWKHGKRTVRGVGPRDTYG